MKNDDVAKFAYLLEKAGFENGQRLIEKELMPIAQEKNIYLYKAAWLYTNQDEEQDTSWYQLFHALQAIPECLIPVSVK